MSILNIQPPSRQSGGFLRRNMAYLNLSKKVKEAQVNPNLSEAEQLKFFEDIISLLLPCIIEPADPIEARELLYDLSEDELFGTLRRIYAPDPGGAIPPTKGRRSKSTSSLKKG